MCREMVVRNGIPATFIMSTDNVTSLYCLIIGLGTVVLSSRTFGEVLLAVLPLRLPRSGPHMKSAFFMSWAVTGQFGMRLFVIYLIKSLVVGLPMRRYIDLAFFVCIT